jgi:hypothetical protein
MLQLLLGKDWITVRNEILSRIASDVAECRGGRILMVPELISHETERLLCETAGDTASRYAEVLSFTRMARRVADGGFCSLTPCLDEGGRVVAMAAAARQLHSRLKAYASVETQPEFLAELVNAVDESGNERVVDRAATMAGATIANAKMLNAIGISINEDSTLTLDKEKFEGANMSTVKTLFNGNGSYGYRVSAQASIIDYTAENQAGRNSTYNISGTMNNTYSSGNLFSTFF